MRNNVISSSWLLLTFVASISAQNAAAPATTPAPTGGSCQSQQIVDSCVSVMKRALAACSDDNWDCKCSGSANIANCYVDCPDDPARFSAELVSEQDCATANAYDKGRSSVTDQWTTPGPESVIATPTIQVDIVHTTSTADPTKSLSGLEESASPSEGAAAVKFAGSWLALVGLGMGILI